MTAKSLLCLAAILLPLAAQAGSAHQGFAGRAFQVNVHEEGDQRIPSVAVDNNGNILVVWQSQGQAAPGWDVFARRVAPTGRPLGGETRVNNFTGGRQDGQHVTSLATGGFAIAWNGDSRSEEPYGIHARRVDGAGEPVGPDRIVGGLSDAVNILPRVGGTGDGGYLVAWEGRGIIDDSFTILGQRIDRGGEPSGPLIPISQQENTQQRGVDLARGAGGRHMVVWHSSVQDGDDWGVFGRCISDDGNHTGEFQINQSSAGGQNRARVASLGERGYAVVWHDNRGRSTFEYRRVMLRHFDRQCQPLGDERQVNQFDEGIQDLPAVSASADGSHVVVWQSLPEKFADQGIFARRVDANGDFYGDEIRVSPEREAFQDFPGVETLPDGGFMAVWESIGPESSGFEIMARRFQGPTNAYLDALSGGEQVAPVGQAFPDDLVVRVRDQWGVPVPGQPVRFESLTSGPGAVFAGEATAQTVTTDAQGMAAVTAYANRFAGRHAVRVRTLNERLKAGFDLENLGGASASPRPVPAGGWRGWLALAACLMAAAWLFAARRARA